MENDKKPKWDIAETITRGKEARKLAVTYRADIESRLKPDEIDQLQINTEELERRRSGQTETLINQKSKTKGQNEAIESLHKMVMSIRNIVKSTNATSDILKGYGVGEKVSLTVTGVLTAANVVISAYNTYTEWSNNEAGIIETDITRVNELIQILETADDIQVTAMFTRKSKTMDKQVLQRVVEDTVTKISAIGTHVFMESDPAVATLFDGLILGSHKFSGGEAA